MRCALLLTFLCLVGCGSQPVSPFQDYVDENTGESYTHTVEPVRLAAEQPALSRVGKDYLYVAPVSVGGAGSARNYLWFAFGSSVDRRLTGVQLPTVNRIVLVIDGLPMTFDLVPWSDVAASEPFTPGVEHYASYSALVSRSQLERIAGADTLSAFVTNDDDRSPQYERVGGEYASWRSF